MKENQFSIFGHGYEQDYSRKDIRSLTLSELQFVPYYVRKGETISVNVTGNDDGKLYLCTGIPQVETQHSKQITSGTQSYIAEDDGVLSFINNNEDGEIIVELISQHQRMPFFSLGKTSHADFQKELIDYKESPRVLLVNDLADVVVTYYAAKTHIDNAEKMMSELELAIETENNTSGFVKNGKADYKLSPNRALHIESNKLYMYTTNGHMGYTGTAALEFLLNATTDRWGVWHENGHQRQQETWTWGGGTGGVETTVNVYSLSAEEKMLGKVIRLTPYYDKVRRFLASENKNYDAQELYVKVCMFWQLRQTFGDAFYPQIHQLYRTMSEKASSDAEKKQLFIKTTSKLANVNLIPFFDKWGVVADIRTISALQSLPELKLPIWENDDKHVHEIALREKVYVPEVFYLNKAISDVVLKNKTIQFSIDREWYDKYQFMFFVGEQYIGEVNKGKPFYCFLNLTADSAVINYRFKSTTDLQEMLDSDLFSVVAKINGSRVIYKSSISIERLMESIKDLYLDENLTEIKDGVSQALLNELWVKYENLTEGEVQAESGKTVLTKLKELQHSILEKTVIKQNLSLADKKSTITFKDDDYKQYEYAIATDVSEGDIAKLQHGNALPPSTISNGNWSVPITDNCKYAYVYADFKGFRYVIKKTYVEELRILNLIDALYSDKENNVLKDITQSDIDPFYDMISNSDLPSWKKDFLNSELDVVQKLFMKRTIKDTSLINNTYIVEFTDVRNFNYYRYFLCGTEGYISELTYGKPYYSSLDDLLWKTNIKSVSPGSLYIKALYKNWQIIHKEHDGSKWIKTQIADSE